MTEIAMFLCFCTLQVQPTAQHFQGGIRKTSDAAEHQNGLVANELLPEAPPISSDEDLDVQSTRENTGLDRVNVKNRNNTKVGSDTFSTDTRDHEQQRKLQATKHAERRPGAHRKTNPSNTLGSCG